MDYMNYIYGSLPFKNFYSKCLNDLYSVYEAKKQQEVKFPLQSDPLLNKKNIKIKKITILTENFWEGKSLACREENLKPIQKAEF